MCASRHSLASATQFRKPLTSNQQRFGNCGSSATAPSSSSPAAPLPFSSRATSSVAPLRSPPPPSWFSVRTATPESSLISLRWRAPLPQTQPDICGSTSSISVEKSSSRAAPAMAAIESPLMVTARVPGSSPSSTRTVTLKRCWMPFSRSPFFPMRRPTHPSGTTRRRSSQRPPRRSKEGGASMPTLRLSTKISASFSCVSRRPFLLMWEVRRDSASCQTYSPIGLLLKARHPRHGHPPPAPPMRGPA
mmetsp:Transcript_53391/g.114794  ORF Transcript_53391/g.114794 Transcript_53391/m.114794 type:complete len:248 (+) Transcript_53391:286-1029(+)